MPNAAPATLGRVVSLWRYPVKSMMGEELSVSDVSERGLLGDRAYALVDRSNGRVASAKNPRKWAKLFDCRAALVKPPRAGERTPAAQITLLNGSSMTSERADLNQILSNELGREITLTATPPEAPSLEEYWPDIDGLAHREKVTDEAMALGAPTGTFFDFAAIHVLTTATLARFQQLYPPGRFDVRRFRPNLVVETISSKKDFVENAWVGHTLAVGDEVRLSVLIPCPRCVMTTLPQGDLPNDPGILRAAAQHNKVMIAPLGQAMPSVGVYAAVLRGGVVRRGDSCWLE